MWLSVGLTMDTKMTHVKRDWTTCSKFANHTRLNNQRNWGDLYDHFNEHETLHLDGGGDTQMSSKNIMRQMGYGHDWDLLTIAH